MYRYRQTYAQIHPTRIAYVSSQKCSYSSTGSCTSSFLLKACGCIGRAQCVRVCVYVCLSGCIFLCLFVCVRMCVQIRVYFMDTLVGFHHWLPLLTSDERIDLWHILISRL